MVGTLLVHGFKLAIIHTERQMTILLWSGEYRFRPFVQNWFDHFSIYFLFNVGLFHLSFLGICTEWWGLEWSRTELKIDPISVKIGLRGLQDTWLRVSSSFCKFMGRTHSLYHVWCLLCVRVFGLEPCVPHAHRKVLGKSIRRPYRF